MGRRHDGCGPGGLRAAIKCRGPRVFSRSDFLGGESFGRADFPCTVAFPRASPHASPVCERVQRLSASGAGFPPAGRDAGRYVAPNRSDIEIVDARSGTTIHRIATHNWPNYVIAYTSSAIYMGATGQAPPPGLWKVDTGSWTLAQISTADVDWDVADDTAAWGTYGGFGVRRLDLATRRVTELYRADPNRDSGALVAGLVGSGVFVTTFYQGVSGEQLSSVVVVHPDGSLVHVDVPPALRYGSLEKPFQDGPTLLFLAYYPLEPAAPPASLHE